MADAIVSIGDRECLGPNGYVDNGAVQRHRLMSENRKWMLSKMLPRQFGDRVTQEVVGDEERPLVSEIRLVAVDPTPVIEHAPQPAIASKPKKKPK